MKDLVVYGRTNPPCSSCDNLKLLLETKGVEYTYKDISEPINFDEFCSHRLRGVPAVFSEGEFIGGFDKVKDII